MDGGVLGVLEEEREELLRRVIDRGLAEALSERFRRPDEETEVPTVGVRRRRGDRAEDARQREERLREDVAELRTLLGETRGPFSLDARPVVTSAMEPDGLGPMFPMPGEDGSGFQSFEFAGGRGRAFVMSSNSSTCCGLPFGTFCGLCCSSCLLFTCYSACAFVYSVLSFIAAIIVWVLTGFQAPFPGTAAPLSPYNIRPDTETGRRFTGTVHSPDVIEGEADFPPPPPSPPSVSPPVSPPASSSSIAPLLLLAGLVFLRPARRIEWTFRYWIVTAIAIPLYLLQLALAAVSYLPIVSSTASWLSDHLLHFQIILLACGNLEMFLSVLPVVLSHSEDHQITFVGQTKLALAQPSTQLLLPPNLTLKEARTALVAMLEAVMVRENAEERAVSESHRDAVARVLQRLCGTLRESLALQGYSNQSAEEREEKQRLREALELAKTQFEAQSAALDNEIEALRSAVAE